jgi:hypothetical protein
VATQVINFDSGVVPHVSAPPAERRAHPRLRASELRGLKTARVKYGPQVRVIDLSAGGVQFETTAALPPYSSIVFEFSSQKSTILVPSRLLRYREVVVDDDVRFSGACAFRRPLDLDDFITAGRPTLVSASASAWQRVIARFRDNRLVPGYTNDFHPSKPYLNLATSPDGADIRFTQVAQLEALYFMCGSDEETRRHAQPPAGVTHGRKIEVTLPNGDVIVGSTLNYRRDGNGFFVHPADPRSESSRVFVTAGGIRHVRFL